MRQLGADHIVREGAGLLGVGGADVVLATSNSMDAQADAIEGLRPDGRLVLMGFEAKPLSVPPLDLLLRRIRILRSIQNGTEYLYEALNLVASGKVKVLTETYRSRRSPRRTSASSGASCASAPPHELRPGPQSAAQRERDESSQ